MVKLAETRTKKKYNLVPRGKALYEDETRFGTKMLEKMGWTKGKGLGAREEGLKDFVHVRYKNDAEGLGYEARDDQWTQHQESFDGLLKSLTTGNGTEECGENSDVENRGFGLGFSQTVENSNSNSLKAKISGQSLEERSKQSRARVHYKKFTKGKDLSQYSEKDLANIFGKKAFDEAVKPVESEVIENIAKSEKEVDTFQSSTLSVNDYFKQKMEALKMKRGELSADNEQLNSEVKTAEEVRETNEVQKEKKKKKKKDKKEKQEEEVAVEKSKKLKKEKKQSKQEFIAENAKNKEIIADVVEIEKSSKDELQENAIKKPKKEKHKRERKVSLNEEIPEVDAKKIKLETDIPPTQTTTTDSNANLMEIEKSSTVEIQENAIKKPKKETHKRDEEITQIDAKKIKLDTDTPTTDSNANLVKTEKSSTEELQENTTKKPKKEKYERDEEINQIDAKKIKLETDTPPTTEKLLTKPKTKKSKKKFELEDMLEFLQSSHIFTISTFSAERFRIADLAGFNGANISEIKGYDVPSNIQLQVTRNYRDRQRVIDLWSTKEHKTREDPYKTYTKQVRQARKNSEKMPRLKTHKFAKRNAFKIVNI